MFTENQLSRNQKSLLPENKVVIITHYNPDDAIGSSLGLKHFLKI
jgi:phosphoesterase RecJ-like protein